MSALADRGAPVVAVRQGLLDRHLLPRVALVFIGAASLAGTLLTMATHGAPWTLGGVRWLHLAALGWLAGGSMWWGWFVRPEPDAGDAAEAAAFFEAEARRFQPIARGAAALALLTSPHLVFFVHPVRFDPAARMLLVANIALLAVSLAAAVWPWKGHAFAPTPTLRPRLMWVSATLVLAATAALDARLSFPMKPSAWLLRPLHVIAFGLWMGGAAWNLFVAIPAARVQATASVVVAAAHQLERFRWAVRLFLPTLLATGLLQALPYGGGNLLALPGSFWGRVILLKLGLVVGLIGIFITCPLWRACSPIRGMCDLRELQHARPAPVRPCRTLDNRGRACAGFVHIRRALEAMEEGDVLEVLSTDPVSWWQLPAWVEVEGHTLVARERLGRWRLLWPAYRFLIRRGSAGPPQPALEGAPEVMAAR